MIAARITEPPVGASTCASGNQVCTGHIGTLTAKAKEGEEDQHLLGQRSAAGRVKVQDLQLPDWKYR
jgi:hypothetical protein